MKRIEITILPDGTSRVETHGFQGSACQEGSRFLEQALGQRLDEQRTAEFYHTESLSQPQSQRQR